MNSSNLLASVVEMLRKHSKVLPSWFVLSAGGILLLGGMVELLGLFAKPPIPDMHDPIFGTSFQSLVLFVGIAGIIFAGICLFLNKRTLILGLLAWLVVNLAVYRIGLWKMGWPHPYAWVAGLTNALNISPRLADWISSTLLAYLFAGSVAMFWLERRTLQAGQSVKMFCPACGGHVKFAIQNLGQKILCPHCKAPITLRKAEDSMKMTCFFCKEHIEFPAHALGQKIPCPHCTKTITLLNLPEK